MKWKENVIPRKDDTKANLAAYNWESTKFCALVNIGFIISQINKTHHCIVIHLFIHWWEIFVKMNYLKLPKLISQFDYWL